MSNQTELFIKFDNGRQVDDFHSLDDVASYLTQITSRPNNNPWVKVHGMLNGKFYELPSASAKNVLRKLTQDQEIAS